MNVIEPTQQQQPVDHNNNNTHVLVPILVPKHLASLIDHRGVVAIRVQRLLSTHLTGTTQSSVKLWSPTYKSLPKIISSGFIIGGIQFIVLAGYMRAIPAEVMYVFGTIMFFLPLLASLSWDLSICRLVLRDTTAWVRLVAGFVSGISLAILFHDDRSVVVAFTTIIGGIADPFTITIPRVSGMGNLLAILAYSGTNIMTLSMIIVLHLGRFPGLVDVQVSAGTLGGLSLVPLQASLVQTCSSSLFVQFVIQSITLRERFKGLWLNETFGSIHVALRIENEQGFAIGPDVVNGVVLPG
jgi:hypothetical protein